MRGASIRDDASAVARGGPNQERNAPPNSTGSRGLRAPGGEAYQAFLRADDATPLGADDLERLATTAYLIGRDLDFQQFIERLHQVNTEAGKAERAARCTCWPALTLLFRGDVGPSNAWAARGHRLVQDRDCVERGYLLLPAASQQLHDGNAAAAPANGLSLCPRHRQSCLCRPAKPACSSGCEFPTGYWFRPQRPSSCSRSPYPSWRFAPRDRQDCRSPLAELSAAASRAIAFASGSRRPHPKLGLWNSRADRWRWL